MNVRMTPEIKDAVDNASSREWLSVSDWIRNIIVNELRARNLLPVTYVLPEIDETGTRTENM
ncbi:MAG: hypothetical protein Q8O47_04410 [Candidatus Bathyarchaeota archaeon]|nr:hypothetical protein [Candidatus Bathyarchaeota archaeon]